MGESDPSEIDDPHRAYMDAPDFLERRFEVPTVEALLATPDAVGVARFIELPSFRPERVFTFVFRRGEIEASAAVGASSLWYSLYRGQMSSGDDDEGEDDDDEPEAFDPARVVRRSAVVALPWSEGPAELQSWEALRSAAANAGTCMTSTLDGTAYWHRVADRGGQAVAQWSNPARREHGAQVALIEAYVHLLRHLSLYPK